MTTPNTDSLAQHLAEFMHDAYEAAATDWGWETQKASRVPWPELPEANKQTMLLTLLALLEGPLSDLSVLVQIPKVRELVVLASKPDDELSAAAVERLGDWQHAWLDATEVPS